MTNKNTGKEIEIKKQNGVLYEPPEPLFADIMPSRRFRFRRMLALALFLSIAVAILAVAVSGKMIYDSEEMTGDENETETSAQGMYGEETSIEGTVIQNESKSFTENPEESESERLTETESVNTGEQETDTESIEEMTEHVFETVELDLSRAEEGESAVINYSDKSPDIAGLSDRGFVHTEKKGSGMPLVMVIHTHTSERYLGGDGSSVFDSVAAVGDELNSRLNSFGLTSLHCTVIHDGDGTNAYLNARETIETMLRIYPSIKYVIDLHRLELEVDGAVVKTVSGCEDGSAQIRLTVSSSGEGWQEDLSLALSLRERLNKDGARLCMPTVITPSRYNSDLSEFYIMADIGALGNSVDEAKAAAVRLADVMCKVILEM